MCTERPSRVDLFRGSDPRRFYTCQIEDPRNLEKWVQSPNARDYTKPEANLCAMCCTSMILKSEEISPPSTLELFGQAAGFSVFRPKPDGSGWKGAYHMELADYLEAQWGMRTWAERNMKPGFIRLMLTFGNYCMLSVHPEIRLRTTELPPGKSGHIVLVYGFYVTRRRRLRFLVQNSAGFASQDSQIGMSISEHRLAQVFSGNGVIVRSRFSPSSSLAKAA